MSITTSYDIFARASLAPYFPFGVAVLSVGGMVLFARRARHMTEWTRWTQEGYETVIAGSVAALCAAPLFWRSGRFSNGEFVFFGPAGQDHLFHLTLLQRLLHHVPPDNFIVSGLRATIYHYFGDLTLGRSSCGCKPHCVWVPPMCSICTTDAIRSFYISFSAP